MLQVAPGGRLPLPLRWSRAEDIRLRPWPRSQGGGFADGGRSSSPSNSSVPKKVMEVHDLAGEPGSQGERSYEYSDCSVLVPAARLALYRRGCDGVRGAPFTSSESNPL